MDFDQLQHVLYLAFWSEPQNQLVAYFLGEFLRLGGEDEDVALSATPSASCPLRFALCMDRPWELLSASPYTGRICRLPQVGVGYLHLVVQLATSRSENGATLLQSEVIQAGNSLVRVTGVRLLCHSSCNIGCNLCTLIH